MNGTAARPPVDDEQIDHLAEVAAQLAARMRYDDPKAISRWLLTQAPNPDQRWALLFILAAAVPDDVPFAQLTAWARIHIADDTPETTAARRQVLNAALAPRRRAA